MDFLLDGFIDVGKEILGKWVIVAKGYWCRITKYKKEFNFFVENFVKQKFNFCHADEDVDANGNADNEMLMPRFPNDPFNYTKFHALINITSFMTEGRYHIETSVMKESINIYKDDSEESPRLWEPVISIFHWYKWKPKRLELLSFFMRKYLSLFENTCSR